MIHRSLFRTILVVAALVAATSVCAQRQSLAERVEALEAQASKSRSERTESNLDQLNRINQLQTELAALRGMIEKLQFENEQLKQRNRDQYIDLDSRITRIESSASNPVIPAATTETATSEQQTSTASAPTSSVDPSSAASMSERQMYDAAFESLKNGEYAEAARRFQKFLETFPNGSLAPNAWYWHGESYYVTQNYEIAMEAFDALLEQFPKSDKSAHALLKLGYCQHELKQTDLAKQTLQKVIDQYPDSEPARLAQSRLRLLAQDQR